MQKIDPFDYADTILKTLKTGVLLTAKADGQVNTMTISWGTLGIQWGKPIFTVFVRGCRHTASLLKKSMQFTVNIPLNGCDPEILRFCGAKSGRDVDKIQALGLTLTPPLEIETPGIRELPLTLECKVLYAQEQSVACMGEVARLYPPHPESGDLHTAYYGQIVAAYLQ